MVGLSTSVLENLLLDYVTVEPPAQQPIFHNATLLQYLDGNGVKHVDPDLLKMKFADLGYVKKRRAIEVTDSDRKPKRIQIWVWQLDCSRSRPLTTDEECAILEAETPSQLF